MKTKTPLKNTGWYVPSIPEYIGKYKAIKHHLSKEKALSGKYGEIYENGTKNLKCWLSNSQVASFNGIEGLSKGDEVVFELEMEDLEKWVKVIRLTKTMPAQVRYASKRTLTKPKGAQK